MVLALEVLAIYALACMMIAAVVMIRGFSEVVDQVPPGTRDDLFVIGLIFVVLTSPFWTIGVVVEIIRILWQKVVSQCQLLEKDHQ